MTAPNATERARAILASGSTTEAEEALGLSRELLGDDEFSLARRVLESVSRPLPDSAMDLELVQKLAFCTYKDTEQPGGTGFARALALLTRDAQLSTTRNQETLGLAGAICKRRFEYAGRREDLERSLIYYRRGHTVGPETDRGYNGINAAFVLDLLADIESRVARETGDTEMEEVAARRDAAANIRRRLLAVLARPADLAKDWWLSATIAEAHAGLGEYAEAATLLRAAREGVEGWKLQSTARQLAALARLREGAGGLTAGTPAWGVLAAILGSSAGAVQAVLMGKIGLSLSGGGFRASLFHIGVLARLAELDLLRHTEVVSCVSGGSILGAHYYLEVRNLLRSKSDSDITAQDYVDIVARMERDFVAGVQRNIRTRILADAVTNLRVAFTGYSSTLRGGEMYEQHLYSRIQDGEAHAPRYISGLLIAPKDEPQPFLPSRHNWRRHAKAPVLILNATTLNTGHNWQFTASSMGEPAHDLDEAIDANYRLRQMHYKEAPEPYTHVSLGTAVAASACVPGLFEPIAFPGLYERTDGDGRKIPIELLLVDGGVHDNQGIAALLAQDCKVVLVSDASGQDESLDAPPSGRIKVPMRSNGILMARVRTAQYRDLESRRQSSLLNTLGFVHLKQGLTGEPIDWLGCNDPTHRRTAGEWRGAPDRPRVPREFQRLISATRTDLDSFSDIEAYGLMYCGYEMIARELERVFPDARPVHEGNWRFLAVRDAFAAKLGTAEYERLTNTLRASHERLLKWWRIARAGARHAVPRRHVLGASRRPFPERVLALLLVPLGLVLGTLHLLVIDPLFLASGRLERFVRASRRGNDPLPKAGVAGTTEKV